MLKLFIVFLFLTLSQSTFADWLDIVKDGLESTIEVSQDTWIYFPWDMEMKPAPTISERAKK